jgi:hypothetical protein
LSINHLEYSNTILTIAVFLIFYLIIKKPLNVFVYHSLTTWSDIISISTKMGISLICIASMFSLPIPFLTAIQIHSFTNIEWYLMFSGILIGMLSSASLVYLAMLLYCIYRFSHPGIEFGMSENIFIIALAIMTTNISSKNQNQYNRAHKELSNIYLKGLVIALISAAIYTLQHFEDFYMQSQIYFTDNLAFTKQGYMFALIMALFTWLMVLNNQAGKLLLGLSIIPSGLIIRFIFPNDDLILAVISGALFGLMMNPYILKDIEAQRTTLRPKRIGQIH